MMVEQNDGSITWLCDVGANGNEEKATIES
jgi:hypothetical protein